MASVGTEGVTKRVLFVDTDGRRKTIRLGKVAMRQAESVKVNIESLIAAKVTGHSPDEEVSRWVATRPDDLHAKLAAVGLVRPRESSTLGPWLEKLIEQKRTELKARSLHNLELTKGKLL